MRTSFRNVDFDSTLPVDDWPAEAIETVMDRGSLSDWRLLARAIRENPWGRTARRVESISSWGEHYGVDRLMSDVVRTARQEIDEQARADFARQVRSWRKATGLTLREFASLAGTSAPRLSAYENARVAPTTDILGRIRQVAIRHTPPDSANSPAGRDLSPPRG